MMGLPPAIVLLSGGLDSAVALAVCRKDGFEPNALTIDYGQRHRIELDSARTIASALSVERHIVLNVDLTQWGGSALTGETPVPTGRSMADMGSNIPATYVPARNTIFLSLALGWAETLNSADIYLGTHSLDYSGYPDCRPEYFDAFTQMANLATKTGVEGSHWTLHTPLLRLTKTEIVKLGISLQVPFGHTMSCYQPQSESGQIVACGLCDACVIRRNAFDSAGAVDPIPYAALLQRRQ